MTLAPFQKSFCSCKKNFKVFGSDHQICKGQQNGLDQRYIPIVLAVSSGLLP